MTGVQTCALPIFRNSNTVNGGFPSSFRNPDAADGGFPSSFRNSDAVNGGFPLSFRNSYAADDGFPLSFRNSDAAEDGFVFVSFLAVVNPPFLITRSCQRTTQTLYLPGARPWAASRPRRGDVPHMAGVDALDEGSEVCLLAISLPLGDRAGFAEGGGVHDGRLRPVLPH